MSPPTQGTKLPLAPRPLTAQTPQNPHEPPTHEQGENEGFARDKFEAFGLQLREESGTITSEEQKRLGVLQRKMDDFWVQRLESAAPVRHGFANIPVHSTVASSRHAEPPDQPKLNISSDLPRSPAALITQRQAQSTPPHQTANAEAHTPLTVIQRKRVANIASGTDITTLMRANPEHGYTEVINFDTGHMIIADVLTRNFAVADGGSLKPFKDDLWAKISNHPDYGELISRLKSYNQKKQVAGATTVTWGFIEAYLQSVLQVYLRLHPNSGGARALYTRMRDEDKYDVAIHLQELGKQLGADYGFMLGDATRLPLQTKGGKDKFDEVFMINAYGFDPLHDRQVFNAIGLALKPTGLLYIVAEATGPTVAPLLGTLSRGEKKSGEWTKNGFPKSVPPLPITQHFRYRPDLSNISAGLPDHPLLNALETRHTVGQSAMMAHIPTVTAVFEQKGG